MHCTFVEIRLYIYIIYIYTHTHNSIVPAAIGPLSAVSCSTLKSKSSQTTEWRIDTVKPGYNNIALYDTSSTTSDILQYRLIPVNHNIILLGYNNKIFSPFYDVITELDCPHTIHRSTRPAYKRKKARWLYTWELENDKAGIRRRVTRLVLRHNWRHWQRIVFKCAV